MFNEKKLAALFEGACHVKVKFADQFFEFNKQSKPSVVIDVQTKQAVLALLTGDELPICEAYIAGDINFQVEQAEDFLELFKLRNNVKKSSRPKEFIQKFMLSIGVKLMGTSKMNHQWLSTHYTGEADKVIKSFLDQTHHLYSHGVGFDEAGLVSLDQASENKLSWICQQCDLKRGSKVLDVGGGWGSFLRYAGLRDVHVHSITVTEDSCQHLQGIKQDNKLNNCTVSKTNFWDLPEHQQYDAIVCLGTIEHLPYYDKLMTKANALLKDGGFLHVDGFAAKQWSFKRNPFMYKYIYPGDNTPFFLAKYLGSVERSKFLLREVKNDDYNYYRTILSWSQRFENNVDQLMSQGISETMIRIFRLYLWGITHCYKNRGIHAYRVVVQKPNVNTTFPTMQMV